MIYKKEFSKEGMRCEFLLPSAKLPDRYAYIQPRGIATDKLDKLKSILVPRMPDTRRAFWLDLVASEGTEDLLDNITTQI